MVFRGLYKIFKPQSVFLCFSIMRRSEDKVDDTTETARELRRMYTISGETGWERLKMMFTLDEFGNQSPELIMVKHATMAATFVGAAIGAMLESKLVLEDFIKKNQATVFQTHFDAKKKLQRQVVLGFFRGGFHAGWKLGLFTGSFILFQTGFSVYRGKAGVLEYIAGGAVAGAMYKFPLGPKGMFSGGVVGGSLGAVAGILVMGLLKLTGTSIEELRYWQYQLRKGIHSEFQELHRKDRKRTEEPLIRAHDEIYGEGSTIDNIKSGTTAEENVAQENNVKQTVAKENIVKETAAKENREGKTQ